MGCGSITPIAVIEWPLVLWNSQIVLQGLFRGLPFCVTGVLAVSCDCVMTEWWQSDDNGQSNLYSLVYCTIITSSDWSYVCKLQIVHHLLYTNNSNFNYLPILIKDPAVSTWLACKYIHPRLYAINIWVRFILWSSIHPWYTVPLIIDLWCNEEFLGISI